MMAAAALFSMPRRDRPSTCSGGCTGCSGNRGAFYTEEGVFSGEFDVGY